MLKHTDQSIQPLWFMTNPYISLLCQLYEERMREQPRNNSPIKLALDKRIWQALCQHYVQENKLRSVFFCYKNAAFQKSHFSIVHYYASRGLIDSDFFAYVNQHFAPHYDGKFKQLLIAFFTLHPKYLSYLNPTIRQTLAVTPYLPFQTGQIDAMIHRQLRVITTSVPGMKEAMGALLAVPFEFLAAHQMALLQALLPCVMHQDISIRLSATQALRALAPQCQEAVRQVMMKKLLKQLTKPYVGQILVVFIQSCTLQQQESVIRELTAYLTDADSRLQQVAEEVLRIIQPSLVTQHRQTKSLAFILQLANKMPKRLPPVAMLSELLRECSRRKVVEALIIRLMAADMYTREQATAALKIMASLLAASDKSIIVATLLSKLELCDDSLVRKTLLLTIDFMAHDFSYVTKKNLLSVLLTLIVDERGSVNKTLTDVISALLLTLTETQRQEMSAVLVDNFPKRNSYAQLAIVRIMTSCLIQLNHQQQHRCVSQFLGGLAVKNVYIQSISLDALLLLLPKLEAEYHQRVLVACIKYSEDLNPLIRSSLTQHLSTLITDVPSQPALVNALMNRLSDSNRYVKNPALHALAQVQVYSLLSRDQQGFVFSHLINEILNPAWCFKDTSIHALAAIAPTLNSENLQQVITVLEQKIYDPHRFVQYAALPVLTRILAKTATVIPEALIKLILKNATHQDSYMVVVAMQAMQAIFTKLSDFNKIDVVDVVMTRLMYPSDHIRQAAKETLVACFKLLSPEPQLTLLKHLFPKMLVILQQSTKIQVKMVVAAAVHALLHDLNESQKDYFYYGCLLKTFLTKKDSSQHDSFLVMLINLFHERGQHFLLKNTLKNVTSITEDPANLIANYVYS